MLRETGTQTRNCPTCGSALAVVELADGSTSTVLCGTCYGTPAPEKAAAEPVTREFGTSKKKDKEEDTEEAVE